jgi:putative ABC transport system permease protein
MFSNYLTIAWRQIVKNKLYAGINVLGLVVGLLVFVFGVLLVNYERGHDQQWSNAERIYAAGTLFGPSAGVGFSQSSGIYSAFAPFIDAEIDGVEQIARTVGGEFLISHSDDHFYEFIRFADPSLLQIFDFTYLAGDARALEDPSGVLITREIAEKFFGSIDVLGEVLTLDHDVSVNVAAVIENLPADVHFVSMIVGAQTFGIVAPLQALNAARDYDLAGNFNNLSSSDLTYMLVAPGKDQAWLQQSLDGVFERHYPAEQRDFIAGLKVRPLGETNTLLWDSTGLPVLDTIRLLAFLVLIVAIVNYTNLATAQSLGRAREIGLRKTMGASRGQLVTQFLVESVVIAAIAMLIAIALLEVAIPIYNGITGRALEMNYALTMPWLVLATGAVGVVAGAYPALLITRATPIDALRDGGKRGAHGARFRSAMLVLQFSISIFMLAMVMVTYFQNKKIEQASDIYPRSEIITMKRLGVESIQLRMATLRNELLNIPGVEAVTYSSMVPYLQSNSSFDVTPQAGDESQSFLLKQLIVDEHFLSTYDTPLLAGRGLSREIASDSIREGVLAANVVINELAVARLGYPSAEAALNQVFYDITKQRDSRAYTIVGVFPDQNFQGFHNEIKATALLMLPQGEVSSGPDAYSFGSIRVTAGTGMADTLAQVERVWDSLIEDYPLQSEFLDETFGQTFVFYSAMTFVLGVFAFVALSLSLVGLFGLAAFMASSRTREIGIRKVMGANTGQIVRLLVWQFSRPVIWALLFSLPLAYFAANTYLSFFADRIDASAGIVAFSGLLGVFVSWSIVAMHAIKVASANPIQALRYE